ncbi:DUF6544 family protein [Pontibacter liquoris]|uniref:DUF6544 family protein n=1 Tax=Pontibacter liquoris TaxID=2905677 RepID=UPI001FA7A3C3|nr:DUF6544 family protein [Pontibacter liquoris]
MACSLLSLLLLQGLLYEVGFGYGNSTFLAQQMPVAWFGIIASALVVLAGLLYYADRKFNKQVAGEVTALLAKPPGTQTLVTPQLMAHLPPVVQKWLQRSGVEGTALPHTVRLKQKGAMRTKAGGKWMPFKATQYFRADEPAFIWQTKVRAFPGIYLTGRDKYGNGRGEMLIKLLSIKNVVRAGGTDQLNQASLLRYLAETCWFPSAALRDYIRWEPLDAGSARATITAGSITVSGVFFFNEQGDFVAFEAMRYGDFNGKTSLKKWHVRAKSYRVFQDFRVPYQCEVTWKLKTGDFTWLQLELTELSYNPPGKYS